MWIVILNFCLFLLLIGFMFYGFSKWSKLITEYNDGTDDNQNNEEENPDNPENITDMSYYILPFWILFIGIAIKQLITFLQYLFGY